MGAGGFFSVHSGSNLKDNSINQFQGGKIMNRHLYLCLFLLSSHVCRAETQTRYFNLFDPTTEQLLLSSTNAQLVPTTYVRWWRAQNPLQESEVIYKIPFQDKALGSQTYVSTYVEYYAEGDFVSFYASGDGQNWQLFNYGSINTPLSDAAVDTSFASYGNSHIYIKALFKGDRPFIFQSTTTNEDAPYVRYVPVPEPSNSILILLALFFRRARYE
jgi:hypothetical protein